MPENASSKTCITCRQLLPLDAFPRRSSRPNGTGRDPRCLICNRARVKAHKQLKRELHRESLA